jgi:hypothetical protein
MITANISNKKYPSKIYDQQFFPKMSTQNTQDQRIHQKSFNKHQQIHPYKTNTKVCIEECTPTKIDHEIHLQHLPLIFDTALQENASPKLQSRTFIPKRGTWNTKFDDSQSRRAKRVPLVSTVRPS